MGPRLKQEILSILDDASDMTIATVREDGYPQATTVSYVNNGLNIYFGCAANSQKAKNIDRDSKVSLTVDLPYTSWNDIRGLSIGGRAERITNPQEVAQASQLMFEKFPQIARYAPAELEGHCQVASSGRVMGKTSSAGVRQQAQLRQHRATCRRRHCEPCGTGWH